METLQSYDPHPEEKVKKIMTLTEKIDAMVADRRIEKDNELIRDAISVLIMQGSSEEAINLVDQIKEGFNECDDVLVEIADGLIAQERYLDAPEALLEQCLKLEAAGS